MGDSSWPGVSPEAEAKKRSLWVAKVETVLAGDMGSNGMNIERILEAADSIELLKRVSNGAEKRELFLTFKFNIDQIEGYSPSTMQFNKD